MKDWEYRMTDGKWRKIVDCIDIACLPGKTWNGLTFGNIYIMADGTEWHQDDVLEVRNSLKRESSIMSVVQLKGERA